MPALRRRIILPTATGADLTRIALGQRRRGRRARGHRRQRAPTRATDEGTVVTRSVTASRRHGATRSRERHPLAPWAPVRVAFIVRSGPAERAERCAPPQHLGIHHHSQRAVSHLAGASPGRSPGVRSEQVRFAGFRQPKGDSRVRRGLS